MEGLIASAYCSSPAARAASQRAALAIAAGPVGGNVRLEIAENRPPRVLKLQARDFVGACCAYYVGIFISAQDRDTVVEVNKRDNYVNARTFCPCEADYLRAIERELR